MPVITLTTDFGSGDHEAGVLKGVIWNIAPDAHIVDLSHDIAPQNIHEASLLLWRAMPFFPEGTVHVAIIDPGVGTSRRGIAAQLGSQYFVGPDNGLISLILNRENEKGGSVRIVELSNRSYWLPEVSSVFHGRDIFSPVAAHLAAGVPLDKFGQTIFDPVRLENPGPVKTTKGWIGQVIHIDHFGNLSTNLNSAHLNTMGDVVIKIKGMTIYNLVNTFGEQPKGSLIALLDSSGSLALSIVNGNAAGSLGVKIGDPIELFLNA